MPTDEHQLEDAFIQNLRGLKHEFRPEITDRAALEQNFRNKFEALNRAQLTDAEYARLLDEIVTPDVFAACNLHAEIVPLASTNVFALSILPL